MATIPTNQARAQFTQKLIDVFKEVTVPSEFLRSFFPTVEAATRFVSIEVQRGFEYVASQVLRGTEGNRNKFSNMTQKNIDPASYGEYFDITESALYDRVFGSESVDAGIMRDFLNEIADKMRELVGKIERAYELQCSSVLETGVVAMIDGQNVDYQRKAASLVNSAGRYWTDNTVNPFDKIADGCQFIRTEAKNGAPIFDMLCGSSAITALYGNTIFKDRTNKFANLLDTVTPPQRNAGGANFHGTLTAKDYRVRLWTYPQFYTDSNGTATPYLNAKKVIILPPNPRFKLAFGAVPQLIDGENPTAQRGAYVLDQKRDEWNVSHKYRVRSCGIAVPVAVDEMYTEQVVA